MNKDQKIKKDVYLPIRIVEDLEEEAEKPDYSGISTVITFLVENNLEKSKEETGESEEAEESGRNLEEVILETAETGAEKSGVWSKEKFLEKMARNKTHYLNKQVKEETGKTLRDIRNKVKDMGY